MMLLLSSAALLMGPLIYTLGRQHRVASTVFDWLIKAAIAFIVFVHIIPEAFEAIGYWAFAVLAIGLAFPIALESLFKKAHDAAHLVIVGVAALGLLLHAVVDGLGLLYDDGSGLAHAIVLHRVPVGMAIWWTVRPHFGKPVALSMLVLIIVATAVGYELGDSIFDVADTGQLALLQAFISGSLIHVVWVGAKHQDHAH